MHFAGWLQEWLCFVRKLQSFAIHSVRGAADAANVVLVHEYARFSRG